VGATFAADTVVDGPPRAAISANVMMPPPTTAAAMIVSSRRLKPPLRDDAATVTGEFFGTPGDADAAVVAGADAVAGDADMSDVGNENGRAAGDDGAGAGAVWFKAHCSHSLQTVADSGISRPHDAQRFTRVAPDCQTHAQTAGCSRPRKARTTQRDAVNRPTGRAYPHRNWHRSDKSVRGQGGTLHLADAVRTIAYR